MYSTEVYCTIYALVCFGWYVMYVIRHTSVKTYKHNHIILLTYFEIDQKILTKQIRIKL